MNHRTPSVVLILIVSVFAPGGAAIAESPHCKLTEDRQWQPTQLPPDLQKNYSVDQNISVFKAIINNNYDACYLVRYDFDAGQHATTAEILVKTEQGWHLVFEQDVSIADVPLVILPQSQHGYFDLCNPYPCCGANPAQYRYTGSMYELVK